MLFEKKLMDLFTKLMVEAGPLHKCPDFEVIKNGACLAQDYKTQLIREVTRDEILEAIKIMPLDKAPSVDGFLLIFYKKIRM